MENTNYSSFNRLSSNSTQPIIPKEYQSKITLSKILLVNLNATITELAKKLILKGFNIYLYDKGYITEKDITTNFYLNESDLGKERAKTILERLNHLSAVVSISIIEDISIAKDIKFACELAKWNDDVYFQIEDAAIKLGYALATLTTWNDDCDETDIS